MVENFIVFLTIVCGGYIGTYSCNDLQQNANSSCHVAVTAFPAIRSIELPVLPVMKARMFDFLPIRLSCHSACIVQVVE